MEKLNTQNIRVIFVLAILLIIYFLICGCNDTTNDIENKQSKFTGAPDPSFIYCLEMGYKLKDFINSKGEDEYSLCVFPDGTKCDTWAFYRGKCGQKWSYCAKHGYDLKDLGEWDGWIRGGICIDKETKQEIGRVFNLMKLDRETDIQNNSKNISNQAVVGVPDPSGRYCVELDYEGQLITSEQGQYTICIFPDGTKCDTWAFYRGKCGQKWSYCAKHGYDLKDLGEYEGWIWGGICIDKETKQEIGRVYDLMNSNKEDNVNNIEESVVVGAPDPSFIYCLEMGYEGKDFINSKGEYEYGLCVFPDGTECDTWAFYRGKCGQKWSYCAKQGYDLKNLDQDSGWFNGGICVDKRTKKEIGKIYDLMNSIPHIVSK